MAKSKKVDKHTWIQTILAILLILGIIAGVVKWAIPIISEWDNGKDFTIKIEPDFISVGQYEDGFPIKIIVEGLDENNITSFSLKKEDITITRLNKNSQTQTSTQLQSWDRYTSGDYVFNENGHIRIGRMGKLEAEAKMWGCNNCFVGESSPYQFQFVIHYSKDSGDSKAVTKIIELPLIN